VFDADGNLIALPNFNTSIAQAIVVLSEMHTCVEPIMGGFPQRVFGGVFRSPIKQPGADEGILNL
jgi:hypothetical protein